MEIADEEHVAGTSQKSFEKVSENSINSGAGTSSGSNDGGGDSNFGGNGGADINSGGDDGAVVQPGFFTPPDCRLPRSPELPSRPPVLLHADDPPSYLQMLANDVSLL